MWHRVNPIGEDPGFGQSILQDQQLVFHTAPYTSYDVVTLQEPASWDTPQIRGLDYNLRVPPRYYTS
jgi:hypothetical protein